ncbi:MAG TPA: response regulator [Polyangiaceae bacterium]|nr:response regulator [Polyangiaceae bacterium]
MRILVVDDSPAIRARLVAMLQEIPEVEPHEASGADEALEAIRVATPDLVLLDVHMPGKSGLDVLPTIKALPFPPVVVILTSDPTEHHRRLSFASGADFFFDKARDFARVVELVAACAVRRAR